MTTKVMIDKAGRVVIPKPVRDDLQLDAGDALELESSGDVLTLRPARGAMPLKKERGIWVYRTGNPLPESAVKNAIREVREQRDGKLLGRVR
jgi:AbrB family looped-hinge helix DNA binding protein